MSAQAKPLIHLNGTPASRLLEEYREASQAVREAVAALTETAPNQRDYYPYADGDAQWRLAVAEHNGRLVALQAVLKDMQQLALHVSRAGR